MPSSIGVLSCLIAAVATMGAVTAQAQVTPSVVDPAAEPWIAPDAERERVNPIRLTKESVERGGLLFREHCSGCHGSEGRGDGPTREFVPMNPSNLADPEFASQRTDGEWFWKIATGRHPMLPFKDQIDERDRWNIVNFLRTLSPGRELPRDSGFSRIRSAPERPERRPAAFGLGAALMLAVAAIVVAAFVRRSRSRGDAE